MKTSYLHYLRENALPLCAALVLASAAAAALGSCFFDTKTTLCEATGLRCRPGQTCAADQAACIDAGGCGNGIISGLEFCDDGNIDDGDGCSHDCSSNETCGNGIVDKVAGEFCDPNVPGTTNCSELCQLEECGNLVIDPGEKCDDGNQVSKDGCNDKCNSNEACGNGILDTHMGELCEFVDMPPFPRRPTDSDVCDNDCSPRTCGDQYVSTAVDAMGKKIEECDYGSADRADCNGNGNNNPNGCKVPRCGDGYTNRAFRPAGDGKPTEACDKGDDHITCNGNDHDHNGIDDSIEGHVSESNCQEPSCGDGYFNPAAEQCEDGNTSNSDDCVANCKSATCGDGYRNTQGAQENREACDTRGNVGCGLGTCASDCSGCL